MRFASGPCAALLLVSPAWVAAEASSTPPPTVELEVISSDDCGSKAELVARVRTRVPSARFVDEGGELVMRARFTSGRSGASSGELVLIQGDEATVLRELRAETCDEAVDGIALILAVTLDPTAAEQPDPIAVGDSPVAGESTDPSAAPSDSIGAGGTSEAGEPAAAQASEAVDDTYPSEPSSYPDFVADVGDEPPRSSPDSPWFAVGVVGGEGALGPAPRLMPGFAGYVMVGVEEPSAWSPAFAIGGISLWSPDLVVWGGTASFTLDAVTLDACPLRFAFSPFAARLCASGLIGRLSATGSNTQNPQSHTQRFVALGALGMLAWDVGSHVEVSARVAPRAALFQDQFDFGDRVFHEVEPVVFSASLGVGLRWP